MNHYLLKSVQVLWPGSPHHNQLMDVLVHNGKITDIASSLPLTDKSVKVIQGAGQVLSPVFFDLNANYGEPGFETKENIRTG